jgi:protein SCO1
MKRDSNRATDETLIEHGMITEERSGDVGPSSIHPCLFRVSSVASLALVCALLVAPARAADDFTPGESAGATITNKPDAQVPLDLQFRDETGQTVKLGDYFHPDRPVVLVMVYFRCTALCGPALNGLTKALREVELQPGKQFEIVTVSFNPAEGPEMAAAKKEGFVKLLGKPEAAAGWHFLTSSDPAAAKTLGETIGFGFRKVPDKDVYLHEAGIYVCTPEGRVSRVQRGIAFDPQELQDSLIHASQGKISTGLFGVALSCGLFHFDAATGKYTMAALAIMRVVGIGTLLALAAGIGWMVYREKRKKTPDPSAAPVTQ